MDEVKWSGKPYMTKTVVKFVLIFVVFNVIFSPVFYLSFSVSPLGGLILLGAWLSVAALYFAFYYFSKRAFVFSITGRSVRIQKSWVFGTFEREITLDQIKDVHVSQGILARHFNCGSLMFVSTAGLEVGYAHSGAGAAAGLGGVLAAGGAGASRPQLLRGRGNTFWDIRDPSSLRETLIPKLTEWREVAQQQRMAGTLEKMVEKMPGLPLSAPSTSLVGELERLNALLEKGAITKAEYEKAKKILLNSGA